MLLLEAKNIEQYAGDRLLFSFDRLSIYEGDKIGLVGRNGAGKTTLLRILAGDSRPDAGSVQRYGEIAFIRQLEAPEAGSHGEERDYERAKTLRELNVYEKTEQETISGGEATRLKIADAFSKEKSLLIADEPTANLDAQGIDWLTERLTDLGSLLIVSHDRDLLDAVCNKILEIENGVIAVYEGNYSGYAAQKEARVERQWFAYEQSTEERRRLEAAIRQTQQKANAMKKAPSRMGNSEARLHKGSTKERQKKAAQGIEGLKTRIEQIERVEKPRELPAVKMNFALTDPPKNRFVIETEGVDFAYGETPLLSGAQFRIPNGSKTALLGSNGAGKTTLLRLIRERHPSMRIAPKARLGFFLQSAEDLDENQTVLQNVLGGSVQSAEAARTILARLLIAGDDVHKPVRLLSGGERNKVAFARLMVSAANVLILDEPTNYLDIASAQALQGVLSAYEGTILFVSHDRAFVRALADRLMLLENAQLREFEGGSDEFFG